MRFLKTVRSNLFLLIALAAMDLFFVFALWIADTDALQKLSLVLVLFSVIVFALVCAYLSYIESKTEEVFISLLEEPDKDKCNRLVRYMGPSWKGSIDKLYGHLVSDSEQINDLSTMVSDYEEYVEEWTHETKTPIALLTLILDNHKDELPPEVVSKAEYIRSRLNECVDQILQYARVKSSRKDYLFENVKLGSVIGEVIEDYRPLLDEKDFMILNFVKDETCFCDKRGIKFMLGQFVSNSIKYSGEDPELKFEYKDNVLIVKDNGIGVKASDLPFIFERGFTGDTGEFRGKATGMGLYLVSRIAEDMSLKLTAASPEEGGFEIRIVFPEVKA